KKLPGAPNVVAARNLPGVEARPVSSRWMIFPSAPWRRYDDRRLDAVYAKSHLLDPYNRNTLKGDYPFRGRKLFFAFTGASETTFESRRIPVPSVPSSADAGEYGFFGRGEQVAVLQNFRFAFSLFRGSAGFKPVDFEVRITPEFNINHVNARENGLTYIDV